MKFNSHSLSIPKYERELENYNKIISDKKRKDKMNDLNLNEEEIKTILDL